MVLRRQTFAGHTLALIGFPGAAGAVLLGLVGAARLLRVLHRRRARDRRRARAATGTVQRGVGGDRDRADVRPRLRLPVRVALSRQPQSHQQPAVRHVPRGHDDTGAHARRRHGRGARRRSRSWPRPLLFASVDPDVAGAAGVPTRGLAIVFLVLLGVAAAEASQITGSLLIFALLVLPAATAQTITARPGRSARRSASGIALLVTWTGLGVAYYSPYPIGFWITSIAFGAVRRSRAGSFDAGCGTVGFLHVRASPSCSTRSWPARRSPLAVGLAGYFVVLRGQVFTGDALSHVAFTGAVGGARRRRSTFASACSPRVIAVALVLGVTRRSRPSGRRRRRRRVRVGARASASCSCRCSRSTTRRRTARPASTCSSARSSASTRGGLAGRPPTSLVVVVVSARSSCGRCCSRRSIRSSRRPPASRCVRSGSRSSSSSASRPGWRARPSARCCCSRCSRRRPRPRNG